MRIEKICETKLLGRCKGTNCKGDPYKFLYDPSCKDCVEAQIIIYDHNPVDKEEETSHDMG